MGTHSQYQTVWRRPTWRSGSYASKTHGSIKAARKWEAKMRSNGATVTIRYREVGEWQDVPSNGQIPTGETGRFTTREALTFEEVCDILQLEKGALFPSPRALATELRLEGMTREHANELRSYGITNGYLKWKARRQTEYVGRQNATNA